MDRLRILACLALVWFTDPILAQCEPGVLRPSDAGSNDEWLAIDVVGAEAVIGVGWHDREGDDSGTVYLFRNGQQGWEERASLVAPDPEPYAHFGMTVALATDYLFVAAPDKQLAPNLPGAGAVYIFSREGDKLEYRQRIEAPSPGAFDRFGSALDVDGNRLLVGAPYKTRDGLVTGAAYLFQFDGDQWVFHETLNPPNSGHLDGNGVQVQFHDRWAFIAAPDHGNVGAVHVYAWDDMDHLTFFQTLMPSAQQMFSYFGAQFSPYGDRILISAMLSQGPNHTDGVGAAYMFRYDGVVWVEEQRLTAPDGARHDFFGSAVHLIGLTAIVGAYREDDFALDGGAAYVFTWNGRRWKNSGKFAPPGISDFDWFAVGGAVFDSGVALSALRTDFAGAHNSGAIYLFPFGAGEDCNGNLITDSCELDSDGDGAVDSCDDCPHNPYLIRFGPCGCVSKWDCLPEK